MTSILLVEDDIPLMRLYEGALQDDYHVIAVPTGMEALRILRDQTLDLIVLDLNLPDKHGTDILDFITQHAGLSHLQAIVITGFKTYDKSKLAPCVVEILNKPVTASHLVRTVQKALDQLAQN